MTASPNVPLKMKSVGKNNCLKFKIKGEESTIDLPTEIHVPFWKKTTMVNLLTTGLLGINYQDISIQGETPDNNETPPDSPIPITVPDDVQTEEKQTPTDPPIQPVTIPTIYPALPDLASNAVITMQPQPQAVLPALPAPTNDSVITTQPQSQDIFPDLHTYNTTVKIPRRLNRRSSIRHKTMVSNRTVELPPIPLDW